MSEGWGMDADRQALPHTVYRMYDRKNRLLYVGMTLFFENRIREHERYQPWWPMVDRIEHEELPDRYAAELVERKALVDESPVFNVLGTGRNRRNTGLRTMAVPNDPWYFALLIAHDRGETMSDVVTGLLSEYVARHAHLLKYEDEDAA